jgi:putative transposase
MSEHASKNLSGEKFRMRLGDDCTYSTYKAESAGRRVVLVNPRNTSKMCSCCGILVEKSLSVRVHSCPVCGLVMDRDQNAAVNILALGLQCLDIGS